MAPVHVELTSMLFSVVWQIVRVTHLSKSKDLAICMQVAFVLDEFIKELVHATDV